MESEAAKYAALWEKPEYRQVAPGEGRVGQFLELAPITNSHTVVDLGCGTGRAALEIRKRTDASVCMVDFAANCLDAGVSELIGERFRFIEHDLAAPLAEHFDFGFCTDVLEHVKPEKVGTVLSNVINAADRVYLSICIVDDVWGALIGEPLHLTVRDPFWWHDRLRSLGFNISWSHYDDRWVSFYGSIWLDPIKMLEDSDINASIERVKSNILKNLKLGLKEVAPHLVQDTEIILLAGGPSLNDNEAEIVETAKSGVPVVTVNGTYKWALDRGIRPGAHFMVDAREFNERFITEVVPDCKYIFSSQCAHEAVLKVPAEQAYIYHSGGNDLIRECFEEAKPGGEWYPVYGGTTVVTRALTSLLMLGFRKIEVFGWDSCLRDGEHHAYEQPENDEKAVVEVEVGDRKFLCHKWMAIQAHEFVELMDKIYSRVDDFDLCVRGDGLIAAILENCALRAGD